MLSDYVVSHFEGHFGIIQYCSVPLGMLFSLARSADLLSEKKREIERK